MSELDVEDEASQELRESIRRESSPVPMDPDEKNKNASDEDPTVFGSRSATWRCKRRRSLQDVEGTHKHSKGGILSPLRIATRKESAVGVAYLQWRDVVLTMFVPSSPGNDAKRRS